MNEGLGVKVPDMAEVHIRGKVPYTFNQKVRRKASAKRHRGLAIDSSNPRSDFLKWQNQRNFCPRVVSSVETRVFILFNLIFCPLLSERS